ncbi:MAG: phosphatase [Opitutaceae bacterium]|nr:phosphatase [Opitutaceae bacterium]
MLSFRVFRVFRGQMTSVAVIDIGSNSIKVLVVVRTPEGKFTARKSRTIEARISAGLSQTKPRLSEEGMTRGLEAIQSLLAEAAPFTPQRTILAATSAVRQAANGAEFRARVQAATGHVVRILSGEEEANLIGRGLTCDPALAGLRDFYVFDLGGGSLECLAFRNRRIRQAVSLQLGCVRLMEKFVNDPTLPLPAASTAAIMARTRAVIAASEFKFALPARAIVVGTGGTLSTVRAILAARSRQPFEQTSAVVTLMQLRQMLAKLGTLPLGTRQQVPGLPPARADVFPTALATLIAVAEAGSFAAYHNSLFNLRYGLAAEALDR